MYEHYDQCISENKDLPMDQMTFKADPRYRAILEHVSYEHGMQYLQNIIKDYDDIFHENLNAIVDLAKTNDRYGHTLKNKFPHFDNISPSNLRYIYHSFVILDMMKQKDINNVDIIEIGGGYGGLCFYLHNLCGLFDINISTYRIYDIPNALDLIKKYVGHFGIEINTADPKSGSFLISNYCFSELDDNLRSYYAENVIKPYISYGFMAWNAINVYDEFCDCSLEITPEKANGGVHQNRFVYLTPKNEVLI